MVQTKYLEGHARRSNKVFGGPRAVVAAKHNESSISTSADATAPIPALLMLCHYPSWRVSRWLGHVKPQKLRVNA